MSAAPDKSAPESRGRRFGCWAANHPHLLLGLVVLLGAAPSFLLRRWSEWEDVFLSAGARLLAGQPIYGPEHAYVYPPFLAAVAAPFTFLPQPVGRALWFAINAASLGLMLHWAWRLSGGGSPGERKSRGEWLICLLGVGCALRYMLNGLAHQQVDLVIGALLLGGCWALQENRPRLAGTLLGMASASKGPGLLSCGYLLWRGQIKAALWLLGVAVGVNLLPDLIHRPSGGGTWLGEWISFCATLFGNPEHYPGTWASAIIHNHSLSGMAQRWLVYDGTWSPDGIVPVARPDAVSPGTLKGIVYGGEALLVAALLWLGRRWRARPGTPAVPRAALEWSIVLLLMVLLSPMSSKPHFATLLLPGLCLARVAVEQKDLVTAVLLGFTLLTANLSSGLVGDRISDAAVWYGSVTWGALALLAGCVRILLRDKSDAATCS